MLAVMVLNGVEGEGGGLHRKTLEIEPVTFLLEGDIANHLNCVALTCLVYGKCLHVR